MVPESERMRTILESILYMSPEIALADAMVAVDAIDERLDRDSNDPYTVINRTQTIRDLITSGHRIHAIREVRVLTEASLKDAKDAVDKWERENT